MQRVAEVIDSIRLASMDILRHVPIDARSEVLPVSGRAYFGAQGLSVDVSSFGKTRKEAAANFRKAVELYFEGESNPDYIDISEVTVGEELIGA